MEERVKWGLSIASSAAHKPQSNNENTIVQCCLRVELGPVPYARLLLFPLPLGAKRGWKQGEGDAWVVVD